MKVTHQLSLRDLIDHQAGNVALVVGNGINRYGGTVGLSWEQILVGIGLNVAPNLGVVPAGTSLTEFYDAIELRSPANEGDLQAAFCKSMSAWAPAQHHHDIMAWAVRHKAPVLTTNFDGLLSTAAGTSELLREKTSRLVDRYPWNCRFGSSLNPPCDDFGIWHINGLAKYKRSIRLGLTHYMGSVQRARLWIRGGGHALIATKNIQKWPGAETWMQVIFHKPFIVIGFALEENEVFLRWLLLERAAYFKRYPTRRQPAWYVSADDPNGSRVAGKRFFLEAVGLEWLQAVDYHDIYENVAWRN